MRTRNKLIIFLGIPLLLLIIAGILVQNANKLLKYEMQKFLGKDFSVGEITVKWGHVEARNVSIMGKGQEKTLSAERIEMNASFIGLLKKENIISSVEVTSPYLLLATDRKGKISLPLQDRSDAKISKAGEETAKPFLIRKLGVRKGAVDYRDARISSPPTTIKLRDIEADLKDLFIPLTDKTSEYSIAASVPSSSGSGTLKSGGTINLKTKDTKTRLNIRDLDIVQLRPYYEKKGDVEVTKGYLSMDADITILKERIHSTGKITLKDLEFRSGSGSFLGVPLLAVTKLLKDSSNQIVLDFEIEGDLNNPKFSIKDKLIQRISLSLAKLLGLPLEAIGRSIFDVGGSALKSIFGK